jgi:hypothetical protein
VSIKPLCLLKRNITKNNFTYYVNAFWFVSVTMATVGYGDYVPNTIPGRFFSFIICLWGIFYVSITFVSLINLIKLKVSELNAFTLIKNIKLHSEIREVASRMITSFIRYRIMAQRLAKNPSKLQKAKYILAADKLKSTLITFRILRRLDNKAEH